MYILMNTTISEKLRQSGLFYVYMCCIFATQSCAHIRIRALIRCISGDVPADVANGRALLIDDYAASPVQARPPSLVAGAERAA